MEKTNKANCKVCGKPIGRNLFTCSRACYNIARSNFKTCVVCGKQFQDPPANDTVTCSPECSSINRKQLHKKGVYAGTLQKAHEVASALPHTGPFETNQGAKTWVLQSPDGKIYKCRNLSLWLREHADLLDGTPAQAFSGISKIKYSMQGKRKNKSSQWKGWRLLEWGE